ncbi:site-specific integrase [Mesorhizobium sp. M0955]|uniref:tyrosine-type recombinase/integrase n=1 Tax=Mesorhizobium sp. M0955 TaxID=2957033 RepID=UPI0033386C13
MSVRKRKWTTAKGVEREAWVVDYVDGQGARRLKTFERKKEAYAFEATSTVQIMEGTHVADSASTTVQKAGELWTAAADTAGLERTTTDQYRQHLKLHIAPYLGATKLNELSIAAVRAFEDKLIADGRSSAMVRKILVSLGSLLADAQERGLVARNVVRDMRGKRKGKGRQEKRQKGRVKVGVDIPTRDEIKAIVGALEGRWRPIILTAIFTGLRASELRGLRWSDVDFTKREIKVHQRADRHNEIGKPKSISGERTVPAPPMVINTLKEWKLKCPKGKEGLVFPNGSGNVEQLPNIVRRGWHPVQIAAGVTVETDEKDERGAPILAPKYSGFHALRHFYASWCINSADQGGLGLSAKVVQERLGHSSIVMTLDVYSHLFPRGDDGEQMAAAEKALLG